MSSPDARWAVMNANTSAVVTSVGSTGNKREEHLQIEPGSQHRVRPTPRRQELEIPIDDRMTETNLDPSVSSIGALKLR